MSGEWIRPLQCPVCDEPLIDQTKSWRCANGHSFDVAREGYANLLRPHKRLPDTVGDSPEMLRARREFLAEGFYDPLSDLINSLVLTAVARQPTPVVVDVGCGEGYFLRRLAQQMTGQEMALFGVDIAKTAVRMAAKQMGGHGRFLVADVYDKLPIADHAAQVLLNIFAPRHPAEFARILASEGCLLVVIPAPDHLQSLRAQFSLIDIQAEKQAFITTQFEGLFTVQQIHPLTFPLRLKAQTLQLLIHMMPGVRHLTPAQWTVIRSAPMLETNASFIVLQLGRVAGEGFTG